MSDTSYEAADPDAMPVSAEPPRGAWIDLEAHRLVDEAVRRWLQRHDGSETFCVSGATGVGKTDWLVRFMAQTRRTGGTTGPRVRWAVARFVKGEPVEAEGLIRQWSAGLIRWVERPARYTRGAEARQWLDLAIRAQQAEGFAVVRAIESDRGLLKPGRELGGLTEGVLWLAREPFRGSRAGERSIVLPVWSHDELAYVLARRHPETQWPEEVVSRIWTRSKGHARTALRLARALARENRTMKRFTHDWPQPGTVAGFDFPAA